MSSQAVGMPATEATATAESTTTLTTARQSSQLLQLLPLVVQGCDGELRRYLATGGAPSARIYDDLDWNFYASSADYTGPGAAQHVSLLAACCYQQRAEQIRLLIDAGADVNSDTGLFSSLSPMTAASCQGDIATMALLKSKGATVDCNGYTPLIAAGANGRLDAAKWLVDQGANVAARS